MFGHFGICPSSSRCGFPVFLLIRFLFHHFRMFPSFIFENFGCSCLLPDSLLVPSFPDVSIFLTFSDFPVLFSIRFLFHHFRMFRLSCSNFPGVVRFASHSIMSGFFRLLPVLAGRKEFDPGPLSLETETQQYVLLGTTISAQ